MSSSTDNWHGIEKIVSGGQTGVDRAALDVAIELGIPHGGWCPRGRLAEDGRLDARYRLRELQSPDYAVRTRQNVIDADGTWILYRERLQGGTALTNRIAKELGRPLLRTRIDRAVKIEQVIDWLLANDVRILNIAGPRGSFHPELYWDAVRVIQGVFTAAGQLNL
jgi:hypothetical protein